MKVISRTSFHKCIFEIKISFAKKKKKKVSLGICPRCISQKHLRKNICCKTVDTVMDAKYVQCSCRTQVLRMISFAQNVARDLYAKNMGTKVHCA